jgi:hypothetical protein
MSIAAPEHAARPEHRRLYTYDELVRELPESNQPCELWDGELIMAPAPFFQHQKVVLRFYHQQYRLVGRSRPGDRARSDLLPGFELAVNDLFAG